MELRPSGGFMGSYVRVDVEKRGIQKFVVTDIYQPDGQLPGHVEPPLPIQEAFGIGGWKLRDANWDVDYAKAAAATKWFFEEGKETGVDGIIAVNLSLLQRWLAVVGPLKLSTYDEVITEHNFYSLAQRYAELNFQPGSTSKRDFLGAAGVSLLNQTNNTNFFQRLRLVGIVLDQLQTNQIFVWFDDTSLQSIVRSRHWTGELPQSIPDQRGYFYWVDSNLGSNKADCCISRSLTQSVEEGRLTFTMKLKNSNEFSTPEPPIFWGGDYHDYVRVVVPRDWVIESLDVDDRSYAYEKESSFPASLVSSRSENIYRIEQRNDLQIIGFWLTVPAGQENTVHLKFFTDKISGMAIERQAGILGFDYTLVVNGKITTSQFIFRDSWFSIR